ncbi:MAG: hypothetical protein EOM87_08040 [Clostridia bacterium]|nr:hypothetical protein [Clostridia bacterium]
MIEVDTVKKLWDTTIIIAAGGGGIPVIKKEDGSLEGVEAVIDKDFAAELLAEEVDADTLMILTEVEKAAINFGKANQEDLGEISLAEAENYIREGHFAPGSMLPKMQAAVKFAKSGSGRCAIITSLYKGIDALEGKTGTIIRG